MSKVSVELLRSLVATPLGLHALAVMLNAFLHEPEQANLELSFGWVILLPKSSYVSGAKGFRPIVCGEVFAKLAAKMATDRLVDGWAVPACCFGSVAGKGLAEALYIVKHAAQTSACLPSGTVFVQVDLSQAFDSLFCELHLVIHSGVLELHHCPQCVPSPVGFVAFSIALSTL